MSEKVHFLFTWLVLSETDTQAETGNPELSNLSVSNSLAWDQKIACMLFQMECNDGPWSIRSLPTIIKLTEGSLDSEGNIWLKMCFPQKHNKPYAFPNPPKRKVSIKKAPTGKNNHLWIKLIKVIKRKTHQLWVYTLTRFVSEMSTPRTLFPSPQE